MASMNTMEATMHIPHVTLVESGESGRTRFRKYEIGGRIVGAWEFSRQCWTVIDEDRSRYVRPGDNVLGDVYGGGSAAFAAFVNGAWINRATVGRDVTLEDIIAVMSA